jgi:hypothetical protein
MLNLSSPCRIRLKIDFIRTVPSPHPDESIGGSMERRGEREHDMRNAMSMVERKAGGGGRESMQISFFSM